MRKVLGEVVSFCAVFLDTVQEDLLDIPRLIAFLSVLTALTHQTDHDLSPTISAYLRGMHNELLSFEPSSRDERGRACTAIWNALKPPAAATFEQLQNTLRLEAALDRFHHACCQFELPIETMCHLRLLVLRNLELAMHRGSESQSLSAKFDLLLSRSDDSESTTVWRPHFYDIFQRLHEHYATLMLDGSNTTLETTLSELALLAMRRVKEGVDYLSAFGAGSVQRQLKLLGAGTGKTVEEDPSTSNNLNLSDDLLGHLKEAEKVSLGRLEYLQAEIKTLGTIVASQGNLLSVNVLGPLNSCLESLITKVLQNISTSTEDKKMQHIALELLNLLEQNTLEPTVESATGGLSHLSIDPSIADERVFVTLCKVVVHLRTTYNDYVAAFQQAANAWAAFACALLWLYAPEKPFDPALLPLLEKDIYSTLR